MDLRKMKQDAPPPTVDIKTLPNKFEGVLLREFVAKDTYDTDCLYWQIQIGEEVLNQKYTPSQMGVLADKLLALGVNDTSDLVGKTIGFERAKPSGKNAQEFPRWYPVVVL